MAEVIALPPSTPLMLPPSDESSESDPELDTTQAGAARRVVLDPRPKQVGRYRIVGELGRGGMGIVYEGRDPDLERPVALKLLQRPTDIGDPDDGRGRRLRREARALARLSHPNVVQVYEIGEHDGQLYIAMELVSGRTLRRWLAELPESPGRWRAVVRAFIEAGRGLAAAHAVGLVHRDVKPDNVMVGDEGRPRVMDFGLSRDDAPTLAGAPPDSTIGADAALTHSGMLLGTPAYMAPEQLRGDPASTATDQYGFAVALHEALYGRRPYPARTVAALIESIESRAYPPRPTGAPPEVVASAVVRALARDPAQRFGSMHDLIQALERGLVPATKRRNGWIAGGLAGTLAVATGLWVARGDSNDVPTEDRDSAAAVKSTSSEGDWTARRLTRSAGVRGATSATADPGLQWLAYFDDGVLWHVDRASGRPRALPGFRGWELIPGTAAGRALLWKGSSLQWVDATGNTEPVAHPPVGSFALPGLYPEELSPDGTRLLAQGPGRAAVLNLQTGAVDYETSAREGTFFGGSWSPDGDHLLLQRWDVNDQQSNPLRIVRLSEQTAGLWQAIPTPVSGSHGRPFWSGADTIMVVSYRGRTVDGLLECGRRGLHIGDCTVRSLDQGGLGPMWRAGPTDEGGYVFGTLTGGSAIQRVSLTGDDQAIESSDSATSDQHPTWLADRRVLFSTDRFGEPAWVRSGSMGLAAAELEPLPALKAFDVIGSTGHAVLARPRDCAEASGPCPLLSFEQLDRPPRRVLEAPWVRSIAALRCADERCVAFDTRTAAHLVVDLDLGVVLRRLPCGDEHFCGGSAWDVSPDGKSLGLLAKELRIDTVDLETGERQGSRALTEMYGLLRYDRSSGTPYVGINFDHERVVARLTAQGEPQVVWRSARGSLLDFDVSPDGTELVVELSPTHQDLWVLQPPGVANGP